MAAKSQSIRIDDKGMRDMLKQLEKRTGMTFRDVVRGVTRDVLTAAAKNTKAAKLKQTLEKRTNKVLRNGFITRSGAKITVTKQGKVWYTGPDWGWADSGKRKSVLLNLAGDVAATADAFTTRFGNVKKRTKLSGRALGQIKSGIQEFKQWIKTERNYLSQTVGSSKAAWLELISQLGMTPTNTNGLRQALRVQLSGNHKSALSATEKGSEREFQIIVSNKSQASLNPQANGIPAFARALNGQVKRFQMAASKDLKTYAQQFASRNGFIVK
jgi:hypothetical protein